VTLQEFQQSCLDNSAFKDSPLYDLRYWGLAIAGEAGEVADEIKKCIRDENFILTPQRKELILNEMANVLYYLSRISSNLGVELESLTERQIELCLKKKNEARKG